MFRVVVYNQYGKSFKDFGRYESAKLFIKYIEENYKTLSWRLEKLEQTNKQTNGRQHKN